VTTDLADELARADLKARLFGAPAESSRIGRFAVLRKLGAGGMGVVYAAYDEELDRKVAVKLVLPGHDDPDASARSRREAQALARLSHPNVVQVYEVGEYQGSVYLAMEFIQGQTLRAWQTRTPRRWQDIVAMYLQAGRGLAAAHARNLVHRDFKPDNVLVGDEDQRARVLDFGLARAPASDLSPGTSSPTKVGADLLLRAADPDLPHGTETRAEPAPLTTPGAVLGTPAYMAPEQLAGEQADARSDIFSFCAALHEALHGVRPFAGEHAHSLYEAILRGGPTRAAPPADVPAWLQRIVDRGLLADPSARWPAMEPLLLALSRDPTRWRRRAALAGLGLILLGLGVLGLLTLRERQQAEDLAIQRSRTAAAEAEAGRARADTDAEQRRGEARRLAAQADLQADRDPTLRLLLAIEAVAVHSRGGERPQPAAEQALLDALDSPRSRPFIRPGATVVDAIAESPDGRWLATGERSGAVTLWATADPQRPLLLRPADGQPVRSLAFNADTTRLAALVRTGALVWAFPGAPVPADSSKNPVPLDSSKEPVLEDIPTEAARWDSPVFDLRDLEWSPDGRALLARAGDLAVVLRPDAPARLLRGHSGAVRRAVWSPDGSQLLTASADGSARVWPARGGAPRVLQLASGDPARRGLWSAEFSPDGREVALASADHSAAIVPLNGGPPLRLRGHTGEVYAASFAADGAQLITVAMDDTARVWERDGSSTVTALQNHAESLGGARIGPDRNLLLGTPSGGAIWVWQIGQSGPPQVLHGHRGSVVSARFSADGRRILTASADGSARRWHIGDDPELLRGHAAGLEHASFSPDGHRIATASMDGTARLWFRDGHPSNVLRGHREGSSIAAAFSPSSGFFATAGSDGLARLWDLDSKDLRATLPVEAERGAPLLDLQWNPRSDRLALAADDGRVHLVGISTIDGQPNMSDILTGHTGPVRALAFSPDGVHLATAGDDGLVRVWFLTALEQRDAPPPVLSDSLAGHLGPVRSLAFTADGRLLSAGDDATVHVWRLPEPGPPQVLRGHQGPIWQVRPFPQRDAILTASADGSARVWPLAGGPAELLLGHADAVWVATPSPDGQRILTTSSDGTARLWRREGDTWQSLILPQRRNPGDADHTLWLGSFSPDGRLVLTAGADGLARIFPALLDAQLAEACARAGQNLDAAAWATHLGARPYQRSCPDLPAG
jgi:WD40 repeat protein